MNANEVEREAIDSIPISAASFAGLLQLVENGVINQSTARKTVLPEMWSSGADAKAIVDQKGLAQISDPAQIGDIVDKVLGANTDMVARWLGGNDKVINAIFGRIMGEMRGKGDPAIVRRILQERLNKRKE